MRGDDELSAYVAGRWPVVVRTLVLLGAPPSYAEELAVTAAGRLLARLGGPTGDDSWWDLDALLLAETVEAWESDRTPWWRRADEPADLAAGLDELDALDLLTPAARARVVGAAVAGLSAEQLDEVLGPESAHRPVAADLVDLAGLGALALAVPVGEPAVDAARARAARPVRRDRGLAVAGLVLGVAAAAALGWAGLRAVDPQPGPAPSAAQTSRATERSSLVREAPPARFTGRGLVPAPWYDGRRVHLAGRAVAVRGVVAMARTGDGVVATDRAGRVLLVRDDGTVRALGRTRPGSVVVADPTTSDVAWVDAASGSVVGRGPAVRTAVPGVDLVAVDGGRVVLDDITSGILDVADGVQARQLVSDRVLVDTGSGAPVVVPGRGGSLSDDGRYLVTGDVAAQGDPLAVVVDVRTGSVVPFAITTDQTVRDAAFSLRRRDLRARGPHRHPVPARPLDRAQLPARLLPRGLRPRPAGPASRAPSSTAPTPVRCWRAEVDATGGGTDRAGLAAYAETRWPALVRTLALLGVPVREAERLAAEAVARLLDGPGDTEAEVALLAAAVEAWEDDRVPWWRADPPGPLDGTAYADLEDELDRLDPATRVRLVLSEVARLSPEQVDQVAVAGAAWPPQLGASVARAAEEVPTGPPAVAGATRTSRGRRARRRTAGAVVVAAALAGAVAAAVLLVDPTDAPPDPPPDAVDVVRSAGAPGTRHRAPRDGPGQR